MEEADGAARAVQRPRRIAGLWRPILVLGILLIYLVVYLVWTATTFACEPLPDPTGRGKNRCPAAWGEYTLLTLCLHHCDLAVACRSVHRWRRAGWAGQSKIVADFGAAGRTVCDGSSTLVHLEKLSSQEFLWCDKVAAIREVGEKVLYVDTDIIPARC
eukprot:Sspe_Gene.105146::Locus_82187_Transcript_1_1_Confidence_1.000_Length_526::g.105146::m.105146